MIFDGDCSFCRYWIARWRPLTGDWVDYSPSQDPQIAERFPEIPVQSFKQAVQLVEPDGQVYGGAEAVLRTLGAVGERRRALWLYEHVPGVAGVLELGYLFVASNRSALWKLTSWFAPDVAHKPAYLITRWVFLRFIGLIYLLAFASLWAQIEGLIGSNGILPAADLMAEARENIDGRYNLLPTLAWVSTSDSFLHVLCAVGCLLAVLLVIGFAQAYVLFALWTVYLSLCIVGQTFFHLQWDVLLLEAGFLAIFFAPLSLWPRPTRKRPPSTIARWLLWWLLFRLMCQSGAVKLLSGDPTWADLTALTYHYETQPLPTWIGWYAHQLPLAFQKFSCAVMFGIELVVPFLIFTGRRLRLVAFWPLVTFQVLTAVTGNYCFFNLLVLALCVPLLDDQVWPDRLRLIAYGSESRQEARPPGSSLKTSRMRWPCWVMAPVGLVLFVLSLVPMLSTFRIEVGWPDTVLKVSAWAQPFRTVNSYGLFRVMTTERPEIIVEGSRDGVKWKTYEFKYKPGNVGRRPEYVASHQPRLDWQMWFAARGTYPESPWFFSFAKRLLEGSTSVLALIERNPFPEAPPRLLRAVLYDYRFTNLSDPGSAGAWWRRERKGLFCPVLTLDADGRLQVYARGETRQK